MNCKDVRYPAPWRRVFVLAAFLGLSAGVVFSQSLAELAKKEKERRRKLGPDEATQTITDRDLQSRRLPETRPQSTGTEETSPVEAGGAPEGEGEEPDETKTREYWQNRVEGVKKKIQDLEEQLNAPDVNWGGGIRTDVNPIGQRNLTRRQELEQQLAEARAELRAIEDEARRAGVPSGWVR